MKILKNGMELMIVTLQQYSVDTDILTFEFEKPLDFKMESSLVQIICEVDKLDNIKNNNITIQENENSISIIWRVKESVTLTAGDKKAQIVIRNGNKIYLSKVFIIKVLESLNVDNKIVETNLSYLEYWEERIKELAEKIEQFEGTDLSQYVTETLLNERLENYFNKLEIQEKLDKKADKEALASKLDTKIYNQDKSSFALNTELNKKANINDVYIKNDTYNKIEVDQLIDNIDISEQLDNLATKEEVSKKLNIENYNTDKNTFATKTELESKANKGVVENLSNSTLTKQEFNTQKDNFQLKNDNTLATNNKTVVGAINELKQSIGTGQGADLSNYYNKIETNNLLNEKVNKTDYDIQVEALQPKNAPTLETTSKDIVLAINEVNALAKKGGSGDNPITITKTEGINVIDEELATYYTSTGDWRGGGQSASKNKLSAQVLTTVAAVFSINTSKLKGKNSGLIINTKMTNLSAPKPNDSRSVSASLTIGGYQGQQTITRHIGLGSCSGNLNVDYSNNDKFYYVSLPELEMDSYVYAYLNVSCFRSVGAKVTVSCKAVEKFDYNFLISNSNCSSSYFFKAGGGNGDLFIKNSITPIKFPDKVNSCIGIGNNILESVGTKDESTYCSSIVGVGNYILQELEKGSSDCIYGNYLLQQAKDINYGTVIGSNISEDKTSAYPNYKYIKKLDYPLSIGYGNKLTDESSNEITIGNNVLGNGSNTITLGDGQITKIYCQANTITQSCDPRLKDNIEKVNVKEVIDALMEINVIRASYRNLEEFKGSNENDKHKLMWDAENMSNIPLFAKDVKTNDRIVTPLDDNGNYIKETIKIIEKQPIQKLEEDNLTEYVDVEVEKEIPRKEVIEDCKEFTPNQVLQALVVGFQEQQRDILSKNEKIINLESKVSQLEDIIKSIIK